MTHHDRLITTRADLGRLNADELEAVAYLVAKLLAGSKKHGPLQLATDARDWPSEACEEYADALFYAAFASVQRARRTAPPAADPAGLAARESDLLAMSAVPFPATVLATAAAAPARCPHTGADPECGCGWVSPASDLYWQRHPLGSPERVQAVEEHRAATVSRAEMARNHAGEP